MAIKALILSQTKRYASDKDPCKKKNMQLIDPKRLELGYDTVETVEDGATWFILRPLDVFLMGHIYDSASMLSSSYSDVTSVDIKTRVNQTNIEAVRFGLAGIENFHDADGNPIRFKTTKVSVNGREYDAVSDHILRMFGTALMGELADQIKKLSEVSPEEEKNSDWESPQFDSSKTEVVQAAPSKMLGDVTLVD